MRYTKPNYEKESLETKDIIAYSYEEDVEDVTNSSGEIVGKQVNYTVNVNKLL